MKKLLPILLVLWAIPSFASVVDRVAAVVDEYVITQGEVAEHVTFQTRIIGQVGYGPDQALEDLIDKVLIQKEAERRGVVPSATELQGALDDIRNRNQMDLCRITPGCNSGLCDLFPDTG